MSENKKLVLTAMVVALITVGALYVMDTRTTPSEPEDASVVENQIPHDTVGDLIEQGDFEAARNYIDRPDVPLSDMQREVQNNRIDTLESYSSFYSSGDSNAYNQMIESVKGSIDNYFTVINAADTSDVEKAVAYLSIAFVYTETWSDKALLDHIAGKLGITSVSNPVEQAGVFSELFSRAIAHYPSQDAYLKRAWFNSRLLLTESFSADSAARATILASIESDVAESGARNGMRHTSQARYYNSYTALAFADILDFLYQEGKLDSYGEVAYAYTEALEYASADFLGNRIVQDIIRMNYAASLHRSEDSQPNNQAVIDILNPVADHIRTYSQSPDLAYEGILVMLRGIPSLQNQNNSSLRQIFTTYSSYSDIPSLLNWASSTDSTVPFVFKLI